MSISKHRMEALVDGVFAIAMTILVLEVKVPDLADPSSGSELLQALRHQLYVIVAYFISFGMLGMFWVWHHRQAHKVREIDGVMVMCSLVFLSLICFFPFAAALFGRYMMNGNLVALLIYLPLVGLILMIQALYFYLAVRRGLILAEVPQSEIASAHKHNLLSCSAFVLSCVPPALTAGIGAGIACVLAAALLFWGARKAPAMRAVH
ncbi:MAG: TMEM175 family protein [Pseudomonadota bacterium]